MITLIPTLTWPLWDYLEETNAYPHLQVHPHMLITVLPYHVIGDWMWNIDASAQVLHTFFLC